MEVGSSRNFKSDDMFTYQITDDLQSRWWKFYKRQLGLFFEPSIRLKCVPVLLLRCEKTIGSSPTSDSGRLATSNTTWIGCKPKVLCATISQHSLENQRQSHHGQDIEFQLLILQWWDVGIWDWSWHRKFSRFSGDPPSSSWNAFWELHPQMDWIGGRVSNPSNWFIDISKVHPKWNPNWTGFGSFIHRRSEWGDGLFFPSIF